MKLDQIDSKLCSITSCSTGLTYKQTSYLFSFIIELENSDDDLEPVDDSLPSLLMRYKLDFSSKSLVCEDKMNNSIKLHNYYVNTILEYAQDELLAHVYPTDLLLIKDWKEIHLIKDEIAGNIEKLMLLPLPGFDRE